MNSAIFEGTVTHARTLPRPHSFSYRVSQLYLDLEELPALFDRYLFWSARRPALGWFRRQDYLGPQEVPLIEAVRSLVLAHTGESARGPVRLLTHPRYFGYVFNPVSFYYCFDATGNCVEFIVAEITNTPWGDRHCYVFKCDGGQTQWCFQFAKNFHISPFMPMEQEYRWNFSRPENDLSVHMESFECGEVVFRARLSMRRRPIDGKVLAAALVRYPCMTGKVIGAIYMEALRLKMKGIPTYPRPQSKTSSPGAGERRIRER